MKGKWINIYSSDLPLRSWWVDSINECEYISIVLPEVFGINNWIRNFSKKLAKKNISALALPLYGRTAPKMDLSYSEDDLKLGRHHKNLTTSKNIIQDVSAAINWVKEKYPRKKISIIGFCFGGHAALIASSLEGIETSFCFYGAGVTTPRSDTNFAPLDLLEKVSGKLNFICGSSDKLIPLKDRLEIKKKFRKVDPLEERFIYVEVKGADHGFMCEERESFNQDASSIGWNLLMKEFS
ncbi:dienelactone hydrolase family protein [Prochlorococcus marinus]|uniref:dienelactone hydrolase family protein n=1 Tax=Prochlorococcus marinus TaxID=1219 RepID=UPI001ADCB09A|nr:dienelactone hydrolase family protein [Prochlorococcus marinus]MBO8217871.1 dienelactone hydrolase family protein [Prochlorococcus marinus XMU1405]MBW3041024.1 dienelactone hydrolase [Prochlorococcus marinus str. MU1405]MBW3048484.1 dienelactone hydrolase [Prochlorococcus marinus str. MU1406]